MNLPPIQDTALDESLVGTRSTGSGTPRKASLSGGSGSNRVPRIPKACTLFVLLVIGTPLNTPLQSAPPPSPEGCEWVPDSRFTDEFNGDSLDLAKWHDHHPRWRGRPPAKFVPSAISVREGCLRIRAGVLPEPDGRFTLSGGAVVSRSEEAFYGYYEARMKASKISMSSTFWMSNRPKREGDAWVSHELDITETVGAPHPEPEWASVWHRFMNSNTHFFRRADGVKENLAVPGKAPLDRPAGEAFHTYGAWWVDANTVRFYLDDAYVFTLEPNTKHAPVPFDRPMHVNMVVETYDWQAPPLTQDLGNEAINTTSYDWVRAYTLVKREGPVGSAGDSATGEESERVAKTLVAGPYRADWASLKEHRDPEWFRDAKFGIYTHWGPVTVGAEDGPGGVQWYGKSMYETNNSTFGYHREKYGVQKQVGYKDMIPKFTADRFDAGDWADLFAKSGARFAGPVAVHHDNFAMWDSKVTRWNSVGMGPQRDITGELGRAIRARGLRFVTTFHHGFAWRYFEPSFGYDGADSRYAGLYTERHDTGAPPSPRFQDTWLAMVSEVLFAYQPDLIWFDFELEHVITPDYGQRMFALVYNWAEQHGREIGVAHKHRSIHEHTGILDFERGREDRLVPYPWLTDTSVGPWFHQKSVQFKTVDQLVDVLVDIVSKNGCMLLNVGPRADGTIPDEARELLLGMGEWLRVNGEAVYGTRPWTVYGEGPTRQAKAGGFSENVDRGFQPEDIRFTTKDDVLYAIALGWPTNSELTIRSLATVAGAITQVTVVGHAQEVGWKQTEEGLTVALPDEAAGAHACVLKVQGADLKPAPVPEVDPALQPAPDGSLVLEPSTAVLHGNRLRIEQRHNHGYLAAWDDSGDWASWTLRIPVKATYEISVVCSTPIRDTEFVVELAGQSLRGTARKTATWYDYQTLALGRVEITSGAAVQLRLRAANPETWRAINFRAIQLDDVNR